LCGSFGARWGEQWRWATGPIEGGLFFLVSVSVGSHHHRPSGHDDGTLSLGAWKAYPERPPFLATSRVGGPGRGARRGRRFPGWVAPFGRGAPVGPEAGPARTTSAMQANRRPELNRRGEAGPGGSWPFEEDRPRFAQQQIQSRRPLPTSGYVGEARETASGRRGRGSREVGQWSRGAAPREGERVRPRSGLRPGRWQVSMPSPQWRRIAAGPGRPRRAGGEGPCAGSCARTVEPTNARRSAGQ